MPEFALWVIPAPWKEDGQTPTKFGRDMLSFLVFYFEVRFTNDSHHQKVRFTNDSIIRK
jgi:hypothetical protein